ncbi:hypothetical protein GCM10017774_38380 [Lentzea cavernae]|uniref:Uncharacterized protein n=1 Tax=Lentzea cavernae TaxID=2020703 RepID=A0ABQ3MLA3_9PSEU|nr:hypothetical protein GCM10017774_38380 [Lentzea cavernae]
MILSHRIHTEGFKMRTMRTRAAVATSCVLAAVFGSIVFTASPAAAVPLNCDAAVASNGVGSAWCSNGTGQVRVAIGCERWGWWQTVYGPWVDVNGTYAASHASCPFTWGIRWAGVGGRR